MDIKIEKLVIYRKLDNLIQDFVTIINKHGEKDKNKSKFIDRYSECINQLISYGETMCVEGNLWHNYLTWLIINNENPFSISIERKEHYEGSITRLALNDLKIFKQLFDFDWKQVDLALNVEFSNLILDYIPISKKNVTLDATVLRAISKLNSRLASSRNEEEMLYYIGNFYKKYGVGKFGLHKAFRLEKNGKNIDIDPIVNIDNILLQDLVGYESQKVKLIRNTEAFIRGNRANNVLLYGDSGTGKSSSIKALLNEYYEQGLRMIELYKHQFQYLPDIINLIKDRNYRFIIFMDDLSFEDFEIEYKYLKAVIEGGLEKRPDNVLIYATSNRRHLIKETWKDRNDYDDEIHISDTMQEKLSLADRFGITIMYLSPDQNQYLEIIDVLASKYNISITGEELHRKALQWELSNGGRSGRTAQQLIDYLTASTIDNN